MGDIIWFIEYIEVLECDKYVYKLFAALFCNCGKNKVISEFSEIMAMERLLVGCWVVVVVLLNWSRDGFLGCPILRRGVVEIFIKIWGNLGFKAQIGF